MKNWIDREKERIALEKERRDMEHQKAIEARKKIKETQKNLEDKVQICLKNFYNIATSFNEIHSITISPLKILASNSNTIYGGKVYRNSDGKVVRSSTIQYTRGFSFSPINEEKIELSVFITKKHILGMDWERSEQYYDPDIIHNKICSFQDILDWSEEKIINLLRWTIQDIEFSDKFLPGVQEKKSWWPL